MEKVVKKTIKAEKKPDTTTATETAQAEHAEEMTVNAYTYNVSEDTDTRTGEKIYLVKVAEKMSREEYIAILNLWAVITQNLRGRFYLGRIQFSRPFQVLCKRKI